MLSGPPLMIATAGLSDTSPAYPVHNPHGLSLNTEYLSDLRQGLERANVYCHHQELWPSVNDDDTVKIEDPVSDDGPQPPPCRNLSLAGGLNIGLRCHSRAVCGRGHVLARKPGRLQDFSSKTHEFASKTHKDVLIFASKTHKMS